MIEFRIKYPKAVLTSAMAESTSGLASDVSWLKPLIISSQKTFFISGDKSSKLSTPSELRSLSFSSCEGN